MSLADYAVGKILSGRYRILEHRAGGGQAIVLRVEHTFLHRQLAMKIARRRISVGPPRILEEAETLAAINHPGIPAIVNAGVLADDRPYLVSEWIDGRSLAELAAVHACSPRAAVQTMAALSAIVGDLHALGVLHRDLKPANILIPMNGEHPEYATPKLIDFGVCDTLNVDVAGGVRTTGSGRTSGTALYSAPEQIAGRRQSMTTDVFGLGAILFELLCGHPPLAPTGEVSLFELDCGGEKMAIPVAVNRLIANVPVPEIAGVPTSVREIVQQCLRNEPEGRPQSAAEVAVTLQGALATW